MLLQRADTRLTQQTQTDRWLNSPVLEVPADVGFLTLISLISTCFFCKRSHDTSHGTSHDLVGGETYGELFPESCELCLHLSWRPPLHGVEPQDLQADGLNVLKGGVKHQPPRWSLREDHLHTHTSAHTARREGGGGGGVP